MTKLGGSLGPAVGRPLFRSQSSAAGVSGAVFLQGSRFGSGLQARELKDLKAIGQWISTWSTNKLGKWWWEWNGSSVPKLIIQSVQIAHIICVYIYIYSYVYYIYMYMFISISLSIYIYSYLSISTYIYICIPSSILWIHDSRDVKLRTQDLGTPCECSVFFFSGLHFGRTLRLFWDLPLGLLGLLLGLGSCGFWVLRLAMAMGGSGGQYYDILGRAGHLGRNKNGAFDQQTCGNPLRKNQKLDFPATPGFIIPPMPVVDGWTWSWYELMMISDDGGPYINHIQIGFVWNYPIQSTA